MRTNGLPAGFMSGEPAGLSQRREIWSAIVGPPAPAPESRRGIHLAWNDNSTNEIAFSVERAPGGTTSFVQIDEVGANTTVYSNGGLPNGTPFDYRVRARNAAGPSGYSNVVSATTGVAAPSAPSNLLVIFTTTSSIALAWSDNSDNESGFRVERRPGTGGSFIEIATVGANATTYSNIGLGADQSFTYRVHAFNAGGSSASSNEVTGKTLVSFQSQVHSFFSSTGCTTSCHGPTFTLNLTGSAAAVYPRLVPARVNLPTPCDSLILKKPSERDCFGNSFSHSGPMSWFVNESPYQTTKRWIEEGVQNN